MSSKSGKLSGPFTKAVMADALSWFTPGVTSTRSKALTRSGATAVTMIEVSPPRDIPTRSLAVGASSRITWATSAAFVSRRNDPARPPEE